MISRDAFLARGHKSLSRCHIIQKFERKAIFLSASGVCSVPTVWMCVYVCFLFLTTPPLPNLLFMGLFCFHTSSRSVMGCAFCSPFATGFPRNGVAQFLPFNTHEHTHTRLILIPNILENPLHTIIDTGSVGSLRRRSKSSHTNRRTFALPLLSCYRSCGSSLYRTSFRRLKEPAIVLPCCRSNRLYHYFMFDRLHERLKG